MREILITVRDKIARKICDTVYVCGNSDYGVVFDFDEDWKGESVKTARFSYGGTHQDVVFEGNVCPVPIISNTHNFRVGVFAGNLQTTTPAYVPAKKSILCEGGVPADPAPDVYAQIMELLGKVEPGKSVPWLRGDTNTITPVMVANALIADQDVLIAHHTQEYGTLLFTSFALGDGKGLVASVVTEMDGLFGAAILSGDFASDSWFFSAVPIAKSSDIKNLQALPSVTAEDEGKILTVVGGEWAASELQRYSGTYEVTPQAIGNTTLETAQTFVDSDIVVKQIPYYQTSNDSDGDTVYIGTEVEIYGD